VPDGGFVSYGDAATPVEDASHVSDAAADGGPAFYPLPDGGEIAADRFITSVVDVTYGPCAGFGQGGMPDVVYGPPVGGGLTAGSTDVVSLGVGGSITVGFLPNAIVDGPGVDFVVFENPFEVGGNPNDIYAEPGIVSVSDDGVTWTDFPCTATQGNTPYGMCGGWHPVVSKPGGVSPVNYPASGGDGYDLSDIGVAHARYVKITDHAGETCVPEWISAGFDLDAIVILNAQNP
jgi:hypothetical protein